MRWRPFARGACERGDLLGRQDAELGGAAHGLALDAGDRVGGQAEVALGALEDRVQDEQILVDRPRCEASLGDEMGAVVVDELGRERAQRQLPEQRDEHVVGHAAVVPQRGRASAAVVLDVAQPLRRGVGEGDVVRATRRVEARPSGGHEDLVEQNLGALLG